MHPPARAGLHRLEPHVRRRHRSPSTSRRRRLQRCLPPASSTARLTLPLSDFPQLAMTGGSVVGSPPGLGRHAHRRAHDATRSRSRCRLALHAPRLHRRLDDKKNVTSCARATARSSAPTATSSGRPGHAAADRLRSRRHGDRHRRHRRLNLYELRGQLRGSSASSCGGSIVRRGQLAVPLLPPPPAPPSSARAPAAQAQLDVDGRALVEAELSARSVARASLPQVEVDLELHAPTSLMTRMAALWPAAPMTLPAGWQPALHE